MLKMIKAAAISTMLVTGVSQISTAQDLTFFTIGTGGTAYTYSPSTCWADLAVYESTQDTTCFD